MSKNKIYFPKDDRFTLFCISSSSTGLVIPLAPFGYPDIHLTAYIRNMQTKEGFQKVSIHLKNHQTGEIIEERFLEFNEELLKKHYSKKFEMFVEKYLSIISKYIVEEKNLKNKKFTCYDCFIKKQISSYPMHKRKMAIKSYKQIMNDLKNIHEHDVEPCSNSKHRLLIDLNTGKIYMKSIEGVLKYSSTSKMMNELGSVYKEIFSEEIEWMDMLDRDFKKALKEYRVK